MKCLVESGFRGSVYCLGFPAKKEPVRVSSSNARGYVALKDLVEAVEGYYKDDEPVDSHSYVEGLECHSDPITHELVFFILKYIIDT
jgi:hypothetical protein